MFQNSTIVAEFADITHVMWSMGWDEKNGAISPLFLLKTNYHKLSKWHPQVFVPLEHVPENMVGRHVLITASQVQSFVSTGFSKGDLRRHSRRDRWLCHYLGL